VTVTEQLPDDSVHTVGENVTNPGPETFDQAMVPLWNGYPLETVAVQVTFVPAPKDCGAHDITVLVCALVMIIGLASAGLP
jgi:hypothetical protein